ncbi:MAG: hypothetical protein JKY65_17325 [Planctomycetes bacterium]|nr:hypothetical protein [Planctomycetota bacterium]
MAAVDPKELAQRNIPLIVLYVISIAALPAWYFVVQGGVVGDKKTKGTVEHAKFQLKKKKTTISTLAKRIKAKDKADPVYNNNFKDYFDKRAGSLRSQSEKLGQLVREKDENLEKWFDHFKGLAKGEEPDFNNFKQHWGSNAIPELKEEFAEIVVDPSDPDLVYLQDEAPRDRNEMRFAQKRYWAQKYLLSAIQAGGKTGVGKTKPKDKDETPKTIPARLIERISIQRPRSREQDKNKPKPLVTSFRVTLKLHCSFRDVSLIMSEIVAQPIPMQINGFEISKDSFRVEDRKINLLVDGSEKVFPDDHTQILLENASEFKGDDKLEEYVPEPSVVLSIEVDVLDFNAPEPKPKKAVEDE